MPGDIEGAQLRKELEFALGQMVMKPPRHRLPGPARLHAVDQPWQGDTSHGSHAARVTAIQMWRARLRVFEAQL